MTMTIGWFVFWLAGVGVIGFIAGVTFMAWRAMPKKLKSKEQTIQLIKKYRAESDRYWSPKSGYPSDYARAHSIAYDHCADDLEKWHRDNYPDDKDIAY